MKQKCPIHYKIASVKEPNTAIGRIEILGIILEYALYGTQSDWQLLKKEHSGVLNQIGDADYNYSASDTVNEIAVSGIVSCLRLLQEKFQDDSWINIASGLRLHFTNLYGPNANDSAYFQALGNIINCER